MKRILVTGGDGFLGRKIVEALSDEQATVRIMSRKPKPEALKGQLEWAQADVTTGEGVVEALSDVDTIVNCMSSPLANTYETDVAGTRDFLTQAKQLGIQYLVHISITGIDRIVLPYYQYKLAAELVAIESGIPCLVTRIGQFHYFVDYLLSPLKEVEADEVAIPVDVQFQPISMRDVAKHLTPYIMDGEVVGRLPDFGGPEVLNLKKLAADWLKAQGKNCTIRPATEGDNHLPFFDNFGNGFINGYNTSPQQRIGEITWQTYLQHTYAEPVP